MSHLHQPSMFMSKVEKPTPDNLPEFVPFACGELRASFAVMVQTKVQDDYVSKTEDKTKKARKSMAVIQKSTSEELEATDGNSDNDEEEIKITAVLDRATQLVGISFNRCAETPRLLLKVVGMCVPFCPYLNTLQLQRCKLTGPIVYEIAKFLPQSQISEISFDDSPIAGPERNYYLLLDKRSNLRCLSLARCNLSDIDCELLFAQLNHPLPASKTLNTLNLASNFISDTGACIISNCLRNNRSLRYLNLSSNQITDDGAAHILDSLVEFPLTADEIYHKRMRLMDYLKRKQNIYSKVYKELSNMGKCFDDFSKTSKRKDKGRPSIQPTRGGSKELIATKAEMMTAELVGHYFDPFSAEKTVCRDNFIYAIGNMSLCCLNFAYNNLSFISILKLIQVLKYQSTLTTSSKPGLLYVQMEGNCLPLCRETWQLQDLLENAVTQTMKMQSPKSAKDRGKIKK